MRSSVPRHQSAERMLPAHARLQRRQPDNSIALDCARFAKTQREAGLHAIRHRFCTNPWCLLWLRLGRLINGLTRCVLAAGGLGELEPPFTIQRLAGAEKLPSASTCFNLLKLPEYTELETLQQKLRLSISEGSVGFAFS